MMSTTQGKPLNHCPTNVKEALEWLAALADGSGASHCETVITQQILVGTAGYTNTFNGSVCQELCSAATAFLGQINQNGGTSYQSTYNGAHWNYLCQPQGGSQKCCAISGHGTGGCRTCHGVSCQGCCKNCPKQICARIFCLIVPVVYSALYYLQYVLLQNGSHSNNSASIQQYLGALGFNSEGPYNTQISAQQVRQELQSSGRPQQPPQGSLTSLLSALGSATQKIKEALQRSQYSLVDGQSAVRGSVYYSSGNNLTTPTSAKDLMLWTIFLPYCSQYNDVQQRLHGTGLIKNEGGSPRAPGAGLPHPNPFDSLMYGLHVLFIGMEAGGHALSSSSSSYSRSSPSSPSPLQPPSTLFDGINMVCQGWAPYEYYTTGSGYSSSSNDDPIQCCKLLIAGIPIISSAVEMLLGQNSIGRDTYPYAHSLEQDLGFSGGNGMQGHSSPLGQQFYNYVRLALEPIKSAYESKEFQVLSSIGTSQTGQSTTISTFREMLLWLQGLPCSGWYSAVRDLLSTGNSSSRRGTTTVQNPDPLVNIIFNLPYLFYSLEGMSGSGGTPPGPQSNGLHSNGAMTGYITELFQRQGIQVKGSNGTTRSKHSTPSATYTFSYDTTTIQRHFCAIVAVVYYVVDHLKRKYNGERGLHSITTDSGLVEFLGWPGNTHGSLASGYGSVLTSVLEYCFGNTNGTAPGRGPNGNHLTDLFKQLRGKVSTGSDAATDSSAPTTFRDTLLWLVGAPLTQGYDSVKTEWATAVRSSVTSSTNIESDITDTIVGVLQLFHKLEGNMIQTVMTLFGNGNGASGVSLKYSYKTGSSDSSSTNGVVGTLCGATVVMRSVFGFLQQRCNTMGASVGVGESSPNYSWKECNVTCGNGGKQGGVQQCQAANPLCKFLCLLGWNHTKRGGAQSTTTKDTLNGSKFYTDLVSWFGDLASQGAGSSDGSYTYGQSSVCSLKALYDCAVQWFQKKTEGTTTTSGTPSSTTTPTTIRDMMLWLIGLPLHDKYKALTGPNGKLSEKAIQEIVNSRTKGATHTYSIGTYSQISSFSDVTNAIVSSSQGMIITMLAIEGSIKSVWDFLTKGLKTDSNTFNYGSGSNNKDSKSKSSESDAEACFNLLVDYTYKVHFQLRFLLVMCNTDRTNGGWKDCEYRGSASGVSGGGSSGAGSSLECKCNGKSSPTGCPMPLYNFLNGGLNSFKNTLNGNGTSDAEKNSDVGMGFSHSTLTNTTGTSNKLTGADIHALLKYYVDTVTENKTNTFSASTQPFSLLARCIVAIGQRKPSTLGDCFELLWQLGNGELRGYVNEKLKKELKNITLEVTGDNRNNGQNNAVTALITAIQNIISTTHDCNNNKSLMSLMCDKDTKNTSGTNGCAPYMKSLSSGLYSFYLPSITGSSGSFPFLQYLYDMLRKLLDKMKELKEAFENCECCTTGSKTTCTDLIQCPNAHPILYKFGFVFGSPQGLKSVTKKCTDIKTQLGVVLQCEKGSESTLFSAFECVIQVTYSILLKSAKEKVEEEKNKWNGKVNSTEETKTVFEYYVSNAMYESYPKLMCTFACKVFDGNHRCEGDACKERFTAPGDEPKPRIAASPSSITVTSSNVTSITAVIPQYTAPVIDPYHYRTFTKKDGVTATGGSASAQASDTSSTSTYSFRDALDFHVSGANCIRPTPVALRSVIDWILRVTVGAIASQDGKDNGNNRNDNISEHIKGLSKAVQEVFQESGTTDTEVNNNNIQSHLTDLVSGLRKFVGYEDKSEDVKKGVKNVLGDGTNGTKGTEGNGVKGALQTKITAIKTYLENKDNFASELGKALLKGQYEGTFKQRREGLADTIISTIAALTELTTGIQEPLEQKTFKDVVKTFSDILTSKHDHCTATMCKDFNKDSADSTSTSGTVQAEGLSDLYKFFKALGTFAALWNTIGNGNGSGILQTQKTAAATEVSKKCNGPTGSPSPNGQYFNKLYQALNALGECAEKINELENKNNGYKNSNDYRGKISELINGLKAFGTHISGCNFSGSQDSNNKSDPQYAVKGAEALIKKTICNVQVEITKQIKDEVEKKYTEQNGNCSGQSPGAHTQHSTLQNYVCIQSLIKVIESAITSNCTTYQSHLDDLKQLCQWLYRMGQLYAHGLKGFVESLIGHLKHINTVIGWIEKLEERLKWLNGKIENFEFERRRELVQLCKIGIENLLHGSYVLQELPDGSSDADHNNKTTERIKLLLDLRLLALDRYTLQVWQDECNKNAKDCRIRDWITFEGGIVRHSNLEAVKTALKSLTGIDYNSNTASSSATGSPSASSPTPRNRIHDFHAICVIQKFSYVAPIAELERSLKELQKIQGQLSGVKGKCHGSDVSSDSVVTDFCQLVDAFLKDPYGIYSFAKFVHTIMGPNIFSAVIGALEELKEVNKYKKNGNDGNLDRIRGILEVMTEGLQSDAENEEHYKLEVIISKLEAFMSTLKREYIFSYPVVTANKASLPAPSPPNPQPKTPTCPNRDHSKSSICSRCYPYLARIFIGAIPNLYRHCRLLYEMCNIGPGYWYNDILSMTAEDYYNRYMLSLSVYMSHQGYEVLTRGKDGVMHPSAFKHELNPALPGGHVFEKLKAIVSGSDALDETKTGSLQPLDQLFKAVMQHFRQERKKKIEKRIKDLEEKFKADPNNAGIPFQAPPPVLPSTVRQVLFWLHEMDTNKAFYDAMSQHINKLCRAASRTVTITPSTILHVLKLSITQCLEVLSTIEDPGRQNAQYYYELYTEEHYYAYPTVNIPLFFYTFVEKLMGAFLELNFVCVQCEFRATEGGWRDCEIGKAHKGAYEVQGSVCCICHERKTVGTPIHAVTVSGSVVCPRPLSAFLFSDQKNQLKIPGDVSQRLAYMSKGTMPCGFQLKNKAITDAATQGATQSALTTPTPTSVSGSILLEPLRKLVGGHVTGRHSATTKNALNTLSTVIYLRDLLRYTLCLAVRPPWSMSENMAFFYRVTESWKQKGGVAQHNANLLQSIHAEIDLFPGTFDGKLLTTAVERFAGIEDNKHQKNGTASNMSHQYDLRTLMGCQENAATGSGTTPVQCSTFMFPLALDVYTHYDHRNSRAYLSWILNFAFGIYGQLRGLEEMIEQQQCITKSNPSNCPSLPMCPGVLTALYQSGSSFMDQGQLAGKKNTKTVSVTTTKKTCNDFRDVLTGLFNCNTASCTPLHNLIVQCEAFLWSIRLPFSLVQLSLWSFAVLFISYVFVVPLDHFKIKSHLFNRLKYTMHPSLLIADGQRRLSEVAYFSL